MDFESVLDQPRIINAIIRDLDLRDIIMLGSTCRQLKATTSAAFDANTASNLSSYFHNPPFILQLLRMTRSVISGSVALRALFPGHRSMDDWSSADIDIYAPKSQYGVLVACLYKTDKYRVTGFRSCDSRYRNPHIDKVAQLSNGVRNMDIVLSKTDSGIDNIFGFHSTVVMNFISGYGVFCAYPALTLDQKGHVNPKFVKKDGTVYPSIDTCIQKYESRGFSICKTFRASRACGFYNNCSHTIRSIYDGYSLFIPFGRHIGFDDEDEPLNDKYIYDKRYDTIWCLGGRACYGTREGRKDPFVGNARLYML